MPSVDISRLTAIVHMSGPRGIDRLVSSIKRLYPQLRVMAADDSGRARAVDGADVVRVPTAAGAGASRNALLARVRTPYFLLLLDDLEFTRATRLEQLMTVVAGGRVDVAAGDCVGCQRKLFFFTTTRPDPLHATFHRANEELAVRPGHRFVDNGFLACDSTHNFFVARTDKIRSIGGWDAQLASEERIEFFVRAERFGLRVGVCPDVVARRWADRGHSAASPGVRDLHGLSLIKIGVSRLVDEAGNIHVVSPEIVRLAA